MIETSSAGNSGTNERRRLNPVVSIITVVYNGKELLDKTIQSIVNQTFKNFEYIIVDGQSSDGTLELIKQNSAGIDFWLSEPDKGIYDAMNKALKHARGNYVWFINAGDLIEAPDTLEKIVAISYDADVLYGETNLINSKGEVLGTRSRLTTRKLPEQMTWKDMINGMVVSHQSILVKKSLAPQYDLKYSCSADIDWVISCLKAAKKITNTKIILSRYLIGGFSARNLKKSLLERFAIYIKHYGIVQTLAAHLSIAANALKHTIRGKKNY